MELSTLENWLWSAACSVRGALQAAQYKEYILPLLFFKRLSDVYADELDKLETELGGRDLALELAHTDRSLVRFYIPWEHTWDEVRKDTTQLGQRLTDAVLAIARENADLQGVIDLVDFNATTAGQRILNDDTLARLVEILSAHRLGLHDVEPDILGRAYEYLIRKFAEDSGQSAGEFFTPPEVGQLMAYILDPDEGETLYDPACGSSGLLIKAQLRLREKVAKRLGKDPHDLVPGDIKQPLRLFGQEINHITYAMSRMNAFLHDMDTEVALGDTMRSPVFVEEDGSLNRFDKVTANPMWNQDFPSGLADKDPFSRFAWGTPPNNSADWGWVQHMLASVKDGGKVAVVLDTGSVSRGSGNQGRNRERDIRRQCVEADWVECVILMPENLFYNTNAPGIIMVLNLAKAHPGEILLVNASKLYEKGRPKNYLTDEHIEHIFRLYHDWEAEEGASAVVTTQQVTANDYNLSPSRYVASNDMPEVLSLEDALVQLAEAEEERRRADEALDEVLSKLGFSNWRHSD